MMNSKDRKPWMLDEVLKAVDGVLLAGPAQAYFAGISIDSRNILPEQLFVAISGLQHDGHAYAGQAVERGASGLVLEFGKAGSLDLKSWDRNHVACIGVKDGVRALGDLAAFHRMRCSASIAAVTGSSGKTTTREIIAAILSRKFETLATRGNLNNAIGLPLTLLQLTAKHQWAVIEAGMNHPGELLRLGEICRPDIAVITNVGPAHLEGLGSVEGVMRAKMELLQTLGPRGVAVLNADNPYTVRMAGQIDCETVWFGFADFAQVRIGHIAHEDGKLSFDLTLPGEAARVTLNAPGSFMAHNVAAAAAVGYRIGLSLSEIRQGLDIFSPAQGRMNIVHAGGIHIMDDTYNANPASMTAALETLAALSGKGRSVFVAGDMLELGSEAENLHRQIGALAARIGVSRLYAAGNFAGALADAAIQAGMRKDAVFVGTRSEIAADLKDRLQPDDWILVKGSRGMAMDQIVQEIINWVQKH